MGIGRTAAAALGRAVPGRRPALTTHHHQAAPSWIFHPSAASPRSSYHHQGDTLRYRLYSTSGLNVDAVPEESFRMIPPPEFQTAILGSPQASMAWRQALLEQTQQCGISHIGFLRHGQTGPKSPGQGDWERQLTAVGRQQVQTAGTSFGRDLTPSFSFLLSSAAPRTLETARIFLQSAGETEAILPPHAAVQIVPCHSLYDGTMQPQGSALFQKLGYAPLRDYLWQQENNSCRGPNDGEDQSTARQLLGGYAHTVLQEILNVTNIVDDNKNPNPSVANVDGPSVLWIVAHAVYLPAAALGVAWVLMEGDEDTTTKDPTASSLDVILSTNTKEAEGYLIHLKNQHQSDKAPNQSPMVTLLQRPKE